MRGEKSPLFKKEAKEEALHLNWKHLDDDMFDENKENLPTTNIDDVELIIDEELEKSDKEKEMKHTRENTNKPTRQDSGNNRNAEKPRQPESSRTTVPKQNQQNIPNEAKIPNDHKSRDMIEETPKRVENNRRLTPEQKTTEVTKTHSFRRKNESPTVSSNRRSAVENESPNQNKPVDNSSPPSSQVRYPSGVPSITLSDLKRQRQETRSRENSLIDMQVQNIFLSSLNAGGSNKYSTSPSAPVKESKIDYANKNGHNNNTQPFSHGEPIRKYKAPNNVPVVGDDDKQNCCVLM